jgi:hypothetical protein
MGGRRKIPARIHDNTGRCGVARIAKRDDGILNGVLVRNPLGAAVTAVRHSGRRGAEGYDLRNQWSAIETVCWSESKWISMRKVEATWLPMLTV